jgi:uncharacterized protein YjbJ (UPF0337 family)
MNNKLNEISGSIKENAGKAFNSQQLELEGKVQRKYGQISEEASKIGKGIKEKTLSKANEIIDKIDKKI